MTRKQQPSIHRGASWGHASATAARPTNTATQACDSVTTPSGSTAGRKYVTGCNHNGTQVDLHDHATADHDEPAGETGQRSGNKENPQIMAVEDRGRSGVIESASFDTGERRIMAASRVFQRAITISARADS